MRPLFSIFLLATILLGGSSSIFGNEPVDYQTDVVPLLRDYCAGCHNESDFEGELSVETYAALLKGGETEEKQILVPGKPEESYLLQTILRKAKPAMPPKKEPQLSEEEVGILTRWIAEGAKGPAPENDLSMLSALTVPALAPQHEVSVPITAMEYSPDGSQLAVGRFGSVTLQDAESQKSIRVLEVPDGKVNAVHFSPDGKTLVAATGVTGLRGVAIIFDVSSGKEVTRLGADAHRDILFDAEFSPDGSQLATAGYDRIIRLWEVSSGKYLRKFPSHNGAVYDLAFSPDGKVLASASGDSTCKIWHVESGNRFDTLSQPQGGQFGIDFTPDGKFLVGIGADNRIRLWRFLSRETPRINPVVEARFGHEDAIVEMALSRDGKTLITASADRAMKRWGLPGLELVEVYDEQPDVIGALAFGKGSSRFALGSLDGSMDQLEAQATNPGVQGQAKPELVEQSASSSSKTDMPKSEEHRIALGESRMGEITALGEQDDYFFQAKKGETWIFETLAARNKSKLDSHLSILDADGSPIERVVLQAVRDSWLTFRGKDSMTSGDFRVHNWREMELNEYLFVNGEVVKLWHYPRGPDSGFLVYPGFGNRHSYFETTALSHPLGQPCYIVREFPAGSEPSPNGLPVYRLYYENDDESSRLLGKDSRITFVAPSDGLYRVRVADTRGLGGEGFTYECFARKAEPNFEVSVAGKNPKISPGSGRELMFTAKRSDGFSGPIRIEVSGLPDSIQMPSVIEIEANQSRAFSGILALPEFEGLAEEEANQISLIAVADIDGKEIRKPLGNLGKFEKGANAKVTVRIESDGDSGKIADDGVLEFTVSPGETITARVVAERVDFGGRIDFGKEDSGRNLPHGVYVDNIGLNGLMIPVGKTEQYFEITAANWVPEMVREFHIRTTADDKQTSQTVRIRVAKPNAIAEAP